MLWHGRPSRASSSERRWNTPSSTACQAIPAAPSPRRWNNASTPSRTALCSIAVALLRGHATTLATSHLPLSRRLDACLGSRVPSLRRPPGDVSLPGLRRTRAHLRSPLPRLLCRSLCPHPPSSLARWFPVVTVWEGHSVVPGRLSFRFFSFLPQFLCARPEGPSLSLPASSLISTPSLSFSCSALHRPMLVLSVLGCEVGALHQTPTGHAVAAPRGLSGQLIPAIKAGAASTTSQLCWCRGVCRRRCPLLLPPFWPLYLHR